MRKLVEVVNENTFHLRNIYFEDELIYEKLRELGQIAHGSSRKRDQPLINGTSEIYKKEIIESIKRCDEFITNKLLNNKIKINSKERFGIRKILNKPYSCMAFIFEVTYFNKENFEYDLKLITCNKYKDKIFKFKDIAFAFEIDKSDYVREISE